MSYNLFYEGVERIYNPVPKDKQNEEFKDELVYISFIGFLVHIFGLYIFSTDNQNENGTTNQNIYGLFLHVLADTIGSFCVLVSCFLVKSYDLQIIDPICGIIVSIIIFLSMMPLVYSSCCSLLLKTPETLLYYEHNILKRIQFGTKVEIVDFKAFELNSEDIIVSMKVVSQDNSIE